MLVQMNVAKAKAKLSELIIKAEAGHRVEVCRNGAPVVVILPMADAPKAKPSQLAYGAWAHLGPLTEEENELLLAPDPDFAEASDQQSDVF